MISTEMSRICLGRVQCPSKMAPYRYENGTIYSLNILAKWLEQALYTGNRREKNKVQRLEKVKKVVVFLRASPTGTILEFSEAGAQRRPRRKFFQAFQKVPRAEKVKKILGARSKPDKSHYQNLERFQIKTLTKVRKKSRTVLEKVQVQVMLGSSQVRPKIQNESRTEIQNGARLKPDKNHYKNLARCQIFKLKRLRKGEQLKVRLGQSMLDNKFFQN